MIDEDVLGTIEQQAHIEKHGVLLEHLTLLDNKSMQWLCVYSMLDVELMPTDERRVCFMSMDPNYKYKIHWDHDATAPAGPPVK